MAKIFIGCGHGGVDCGACANGLRESEVALAIGLEVTRILRLHNIDVMISRITQGTDEKDKLNAKISRCNAYSPDYAIDIHCNAGGGKGFEAIVYSGGGKSLAMGKNVEAEIIKAGQTSRGMKTRLNNQGKDYFGFIRMVKAPSAIIETAFIDNAEDVKWLKDAKHRNILAMAIAKGLLNTLGIKYKENTAESKIEEKSSDMKVIYERFEDIPEWGKATIKKLMNKGALKGDSSGKINISDEILRVYVVNDRMGVYGK